MAKTEIGKRLQKVIATGDKLCGDVAKGLTALREALNELREGSKDEEDRHEGK